MKKPILLLVILLCGIIFSYSQNFIPDNSPLIGTWFLSAPKKSPGPEFIPESYKGMTNFTINPGDAESEASGLRDKKTGLFSYTIKFIAEWDGVQLTGKVTAVSWDANAKNLYISVPFIHDAAKNMVIININNPEYGNKNFIFKPNTY